MPGQLMRLWEVYRVARPVIYLEAFAPVSHPTTPGESYYPDSAEVQTQAGLPGFEPGTYGFGDHRSAS